MTRKGNVHWIQRLWIILLTIAVVVSMSGLTALTAHAADSQTVTAGDEITAGGTYQVAPGASGGVITVSTSEAVTLVGSGVSAEANTNLSFDCTEAGTDLTVQDLHISNTSTTVPTFNFTGAGNKLTYVGTSMIDKDTNATGYALIHVPYGAELTISGKDADDSLYLYKREQGAGIGGNSGEGNGTITFEQGNLFIKGSKQGAVIGCGANASSASTGEITINGGTINVIGVARGAGIGGSAGSDGAASGTVVNVNGGLINVNADWTGAAIGGGGYAGGNDADGGTLVYKAGSIRTFIDQNAVTSWGADNAGVHDNKAITASVVNSSGEDLALLAFDTSKMDDADRTGTYSIAEGNSTLYSGSLHQYTYVNENTEKDGQTAVSDTKSNWKDNLDDAHLYLYLTKDNHTLDVNGETWNVSWNKDSSSFELQHVQTTYGENGFNAANTKYNPDANNYIVTTKAQWKLLADAVNHGDTFKGKTIKLDADIDLSGTDWTPIGNADHHFEGTLDGQGHSISNLSVSTDSGYSGLFGYNAGTIRNMTVSGSVKDTSSKDFVGGIAGFNCGTIEKTASSVTIEAGSCYNVGGIAGLSTSGYWVSGSGILQHIEDAAGLITQCAVNADVTGYSKVGGVAGENAGTVSKCSTAGKIDGTNAGSKNGVGGIAGRNGNNKTAMETGIIDSCYSTASVGRTGQKWVAGMAGFNNGTYGCSTKTDENGKTVKYFTYNGEQIVKEPSTIKNSYFAGTLTGMDYTNPIAGSQEGTASNCYSLEGLKATGNTEAETGIKVSEKTLKSFSMITKLGDAFAADLNSANNGYPVLAYTLSEGDQAASSVVAAISALDIDSLKLDDADTVAGLRKALNGLTDSQKAKIETLAKLDVLENTLAAAEQKISALQIDNVKSILKALPDAENVTAADSEAVAKARTAYNKLTDDQKDAISYRLYDKLMDDEAALKALKPNAVKAEINALPAADKIAVSDQAAIKKARADFDALTSDQQDAVGYTAVKKLEAAEAALTAAQNAAAKKAFQARTLITKKAKAGKKKVTIRWTKLSGAKGYKIVYGTNKKITKSRKTITVSKGTASSKLIKKLKTGRRYYYKVRAYKTIGGKTVYTKYSKIRSVKVK